jgi:hypothetical protein
MVGYSNPPLRHQLEFVLFDLPSTTVRIDFPTSASAENLMLMAMPSIQIGASYSAPALVVSNLFIQPRRLQFTIANPPAQLPITLQIACPGPFVFGWLQVPENVQTAIATVAQRLRIVGPSYWALPLGEAVGEPPPLPHLTAAEPAEKVPEPKSSPAPARVKTETTAS